MKVKFSHMLKYLRNRANMSMADLAKRIGVTPNYIGNVEKEYSSPPTMERCELIAKALNLSAVETNLLIDAAMEGRISGNEFEWITSKQKTSKVPVISWVHANNFSDAIDNFPVGISENYVETFTKGNNIFALLVKNACMIPEFIDGDIIIINPNIEAHNGDYVVVRDSKNDEATFKQFIKKGKNITLHPLNPKSKDIVLDHDERYSVIGVVVEKIKKYR